MRQEITKMVADGSLSVAVGSGVATKLGLFEFINANAPALGWITSLIGIVIATIFYLMTYVKSKQADENKADIKLVNERLDVVDTGIKQIIDRLSQRRSDK